MLGEICQNFGVQFWSDKKSFLSGKFGRARVRVPANSLICVELLFPSIIRAGKSRATKLRRSIHADNLQIFHKSISISSKLSSNIQPQHPVLKKVFYQENLGERGLGYLRTL